MKTTALIMAGGRGERFWPKSRKNLPKQFLSLTNDGKTMIQLTVERILPLVAMEDIYIATNESYRELVKTQLPNLPEQNILCEPVGRNTAPCIGLGAMHIKAKYDDAMMIVLPSDHLIKQKTLFLKTLRNACEVAEKNSNLVTIGITPDYPETGYGYICYDENISLGQAYKVAQFVEKPDLETAKSYLESGQYLWNSGMFVWKTSVILDAFREYMPELYGQMLGVYDSLCTGSERDAIAGLYPQLKSESVDYGIMEKAENVLVIPAEFGWNDVGTWDALDDISEPDQDGNVIRGDHLGIDSHHCIVYGDKRLIATVGIQNLIIVDTGDALLVCDKNNTQDVKSVVEELKRRQRTDLI